MLTNVKIAKVGFVAITAIFLLWTNTAIAAPGVGSAAPSFEIKSTEGNIVKSQDLKGKVVVIFFGTRTVSDYVNDYHLELEETYKGKNVAVFTVAINPPSFMLDTALKLASRTPMLIDRGGKMSQAFGVADEDGDAIRDLTVFLIDKDWKIKVIQEEDVSDDFNKLIDNCLK
jgi:peroxiredoxin